jgi:hypothetical protein
VGRCPGASVAPIKTESCLSRDLAARDLTERIDRWTARQAAGQVDQGTVLAVALGGAGKMQWPAEARDGSTGKLCQGHRLCHAVGADPYGEWIAPLWAGLVSGNGQILKAIEMVTEATQGRGIIPIDLVGPVQDAHPFDGRGLTFCHPAGRRLPYGSVGGQARSVARAARWCANDVGREETYRSSDETQDLEEVRARSHLSLRNVRVLVHAVLCFVSVVIGAGVRLRRVFQEVYLEPKRLLKTASFFHYAVADGVYRLPCASRGGPARPPALSRGPRQVALPFAVLPAWEPMVEPQWRGDLPGHSPCATLGGCAYARCRWSRPSPRSGVLREAVSAAARRGVAATGAGPLPRPSRPPSGATLRGASPAW